MAEKNTGRGKDCMSEIIIKGDYADAKVFTVNDESRAVE